MSLSPSEISLQKEQLRPRMKARRALIEANERIRASEIICAILGDWLSSRAETRIAVYLARPVEIDLDLLAVELLRANRIVCASH